MLSAENLAYRYRPQLPWLFRNFSLVIEAGEMVGLLGPSGQGKTTLARVLAGYFTPQEGRVQVDGAPLPARGYCPVQMIFQHPELAINPRWQIRQAIGEAYLPDDAMFEALSIEKSWLTRWPHELSGGELQRIAVARALGPQTRYLIADEMTTMLDAITQAQIWLVIRQQAKARRLGVLVISHEEALLKRLCSRVVTLAG